MLRLVVVVGLVAAWAAGCSSESDDTGVGDVGPLNAVGMQPPPSPTTPGTPTSDPTVTQPPVTGMAGTGALPTAPSDPGTMLPTEPTLEPPPTNGGRSLAPEGVCTTNASARVPCHDDPDPCGLNSGYPGDEFCLLPPPPELGVQIHLGPSNYDDPAEVARYLLHPGEEVNIYGIADIPLAEDKFYNFVQLRMRPGSHHIINRIVSKQATEGFVPGFDCPGQVLTPYFVGAQSPARDDPAHGIVAPENEGLGRTINGNASLCINQHAYNFDQAPILREIWINVYFMDPSEVTQQEARIVVNAPVGSIPPGAHRELTATGTVIGSGRIINLYGHRHAWTSRFAAWLNDELIYDSWDWVESVVYDYNSVTENPPINTPAMVDGAVSGVVEVNTGDTVRILCDVYNESDNTLTFKNEAYDGEMCILFGASVGATVGGFGF